MRFSRPKLPAQSLPALRKVPAELVRPFDVMVAPVYVYLALNEKFVAVKAPLHFFSPEELAKLRGYQEFYLPEFVDAVIPYQRAGEAVRRLFTVRAVHTMKTSKGDDPIELPVAPHDLDDAVIRIVAPLWGGGARIEPFFLVFFAAEVCGAFAPDTLAAELERDQARLELAVLRSSAAVFFALHVGICDPRLLPAVRDLAFRRTVDPGAAGPARSELEQLGVLAELLIPAIETREVTQDALKPIELRVARKLQARLDRVITEFVKPEQAPATLYGERGFRDE